MTVTRGTSNTNARGSAAARRTRKLYLLEVYAADVDVLLPHEVHELDEEFWDDGVYGLFDVEEFGDWPAIIDIVTGLYEVPAGLGRSAVRCYRCGHLLHYDTMEVDRIKPGCLGGTYARTNIRPACGDCNKITGAQAQQWAKARREQRRASQRARRARAAAIA